MSERLTPTPTEDGMAQDTAGPATLTEALDYAARGEKGYNYYDARGRLREVLPYRELARLARVTAGRLRTLGLKPGDRVAIALDTGAEFPVAFFGCRYAGLVPVALPMPVHLGTHHAYVDKLRGLIQACDAALVIAGSGVEEFVEEALSTLDRIPFHTPDSLAAVEADARPLPAQGADDVAYIQFTSGSTRFSRGSVITEGAVLSNLRATIEHGLRITPRDRCASWLPVYHDMGLVGFYLAPVLGLMSVDYLKPRDFGVRPLQWLKLISTNRCTIAFSPPFGYDLCCRRLRPGQLEGLDLSSWRVAGVGAEVIHPAVLERFAEQLAPVGFNPRAFVAAYGLAEASLAVAFAPLGEGARVVKADAEALTEDAVLEAPRAPDRRQATLVDCGYVLHGHELAIRDEADRPLPDSRIGRIKVRGPSLMRGYFRDPASTGEVLDEAGWLDTGDLGCLVDGRLVITGRRKDLIIVNGRNILPQDLEHLLEARAGIRAGDASAFAVPGPDGADRVVLVVHCRLQDTRERSDLIKRIQHMVYEHSGVHCEVELVPPHTLPRTSSGKLSRSAARRDYLRRNRLRDRGEQSPGSRSLEGAA